MTAVTIGYANLDWARSVAAQRADIDELYAKAHVAALLECKVDLRGRAAHVAQPARLREAIMSHRRLIRQGSVRASKRNFGHRIGARRHVWAVPDLGAGLPRTAVIVSHPPPKRMQGRRAGQPKRGPLYAAYVVSLVALVAQHRALGRQVIVLTDANALIQRDPQGLRRRFRGRLYGHRIDGAWLSPGIARYVTQYREEPRPGRTDNHPFIYLTLEAS